MIVKKGLDEALAERTAKMRETYEDTLKTSRTNEQLHKDRADKADTRYDRSVVETQITSAALSENSGVAPAAIADLLRRGHQVFSVGENGKLVAKEGDVTLHGGDGTSDLSASEWIEGLKEDSPHYFKNSQGGGSGNNDSGSRNLGGFSQADFDNLSGSQKLAIANKAARQRS